MAGADGGRRVDIVATLPLVREELTIRTREVETARVRITNRVHHEAVERSQKLTRTEVRVERHQAPLAADAPLLDAPPALRRSGTTTIFPLYEEVLVVRYRILGEVHVCEETVETDQPIQTNLRRNEIEVERRPLQPPEEPVRRRVPPSSS